MTQIELNKVLELHSKWLVNHSNGQKADLTGAYLYKANLTEANLTEANLTGAYLTGANLYEANLTGAYLTGANLYEANLTGANLTGANLTEANLTGANLTGANLYEANLTGANLTGAKIYHFQYEKHSAYYVGTDVLYIGCHTKTIVEWIKVYKNVGKKEGYTDLQIKLYGQLIKNCAKLYNMSKGIKK